MCISCTSEFIHLDNNIMPMAQWGEKLTQTDSDTCSRSYRYSVMASRFEAIMSEPRVHPLCIYICWIYKNIINIIRIV